MLWTLNPWHLAYIIGIQNGSLFATTLGKTLAERSLTLRQLHSAWDYEYFNPRWIRFSLLSSRVFSKLNSENTLYLQVGTSGLSDWEGDTQVLNPFYCGNGKIAKQNWRWRLAKHSTGRPGECKRKVAREEKIKNLNPSKPQCQSHGEFQEGKLMLLNQTQVHPPMSLRPIYWHPIVVKESTVLIIRHL